MSDEPPDDDADPGFVDDDGTLRCGVPKTSGGQEGDPCRHPVPGGTCPSHGDRSQRRESIQADDPDDVEVVDGVGSGDPGHRQGDGAAPEGNKNRMTHGLHAVQDDPRGTLRWLEDNDPKGYDWVLAKWESYLSDAPFPADSAKSDDVLEACLMKYAVRGARHQQIERGLTDFMKVQTDDGPSDTKIEAELPANLPANRIAREARSMLKDLGVLDDPESQKADAMADWGAAAKRVAERQESDD